MDQLFECEITADESERELLYAALYDAGITSFVDSDPQEGRRAAVTFYCRASSELDSATRRVKDAAAAAGARWALNVRKIEERDWQESWKQAWSAQEVGDSFVVSPSWLRPEASDRRVIFIDPKTAFGTGTHATTKLCIRCLEKLLGAQPGQTVLDVGCGTGILSFAARLAGASEVRGIDLSEEITECARENAELNGLSDISFTTEPLAGLAWEADIVVANLLASVIEENWSELRRRAAKVLILSGILNTEVEPLAAALDLKQREETSMGEWAALVLYRDMFR